MRTSDHPAAKPRQYRPPVFRADDERDSVDQDAPSTPLTISDEHPDEMRVKVGHEPIEDIVGTKVARIEEDPETGELIQVRVPYNTPLPGEGEGTPFRDLLPQPTREPIASAPQDGSYLRAFWGPDDETGRLVRWREGRHFNNRRWVTGGTWAPADGMVPLPAELPSEWLKPPEDEPAEAEEEAA